MTHDRYAYDLRDGLERKRPACAPVRQRSKTARLFIEIKWIDKQGSWRRIIKEINDDVQSYVTHPACQHLIFVVIDAVKDIPDPAQFERELGGSQKINGKEIKIEVFVREP